LIRTRAALDLFHSKTIFPNANPFPIMIRSLSLSSLGLALAFAAATLSAQEVTVPGNGRTPVSVPAFGGDGGAEAAKIVAADLNRTLLIDAQSATGAPYVATGLMAGGSLSAQLLQGNTPVLTKSYAGDLRHMSHEFADDITLAVTKSKGFATSRLAFISSATGNKELYTADIDGFNSQQLTNDRTISARPKWSFDGSALAYTSYKSGYPDAYVIRLASNSRTRVAFFPGINSGPAFSPDGHTLALTLSKDGNPQIYTIPVTGGAATRLTQGHGTETSPTWAPDGSKIAYDSDERGSVQLYTVANNGGNPARLPTNVGYSAEPDWSPDGSKIAFTARVAGQFQIGVYDMVSGQSQVITTTGGEDPSWTRNSRHLVYSHGGAIWILDTVTHQTAKLDIGLSQSADASVSR